MINWIRAALRGPSAQTALEDMSKQVSDAQHVIDPIKIGSDAEQADRDATSAALAGAATATLNARDALALHDRSVNRDQLMAADAAVTSLLVRLRESG